MTTERLASGLPRLDAILGGGLPANAVTLVAGLPGSGKTILTQHYLFHNATSERPAFYFSTIFEPLDKLLRYVQSFDFYEQGAIGSSIYFDDLGHLAAQSGLAAVLDRVDQAIKETRPGVIVIDSFKGLLAAHTDPGERALFTWELASRLAAFPASIFWVGGYDQSELQDKAEYAVADAIFYLSNERTGDREMRMFQVLKLRGSSYLTGRHAFRLTTGGFEVFPRLADIASSNKYDLGQVRTTSGVEMLDTLLEGGLVPGSSTLLAGPSGIGKTVLGLHFIVAGAKRGETGVIATFQENPTQLAQTAQGFGWSLDQPNIEVLYRSQVDLHIDEWVYSVLDAIERLGAKRLLVDSIDDLRSGASDPQRFREYMYSLAQRSSRQGVTVVMTNELSQLYGADSLSDHGVSHFCDNVVNLHYEREGKEIRRTLTVLKTRTAHHDSSVHNYRITASGIVPANDAS